MLNKKSLPFLLILSLLLPSCKTRTTNILKSRMYWITDNSGFVFKMSKNLKADKMIDCLDFVNYNYQNSNFSFSNPLFNYQIIISENYKSEVFLKNGGSENLYQFFFFFPNKSDRRQEYLSIETTAIFTADGEEIEDDETAQKIQSFFSNDTKLFPYELENYYLINAYGVHLYNDDIFLFSGYNQFSFLTGTMKDNDGNDKEVIFKSISNNQYKVYEFINKEEAGELLLEGEMSEIKDEDQLCSIDINVTKDYFFNNKYSALTLSVSYTNSAIIENNPKNLEFFFPEDIE